MIYLKGWMIGMVKSVSKKIAVSIDISHWDMMKEFDQAYIRK